MENQNQNAQSASAASTAEAAEGATNTNAHTNTATGTVPESDSFDELMQQSPMLCPVSKWLKCLRKPAISMEYSIRKRHIPDLDAMPQSADLGDGKAGTAGKGQNSDAMDVTGGFAIRYFDLALGVMGLALLGCIWKGCCCLKRIMK